MKYEDTLFIKPEVLALKHVADKIGTKESHKFIHYNAKGKFWEATNGCILARIANSHNVYTEKSFTIDPKSFPACIKKDKGMAYMDVLEFDKLSIRTSTSETIVNAGTIPYPDTSRLYNKPQKATVRTKIRLKVLTDLIKLAKDTSATSILFEIEKEEDVNNSSIKFECVNQYSTTCDGVLMPEKCYN